MKTKKTVIAVLTVMLLISAALIIGCLDDVVSLKQGTEDETNYVIPPGKALVKFKFSDIDARTILPDSSSTGFEIENMFFDVVFSTTSNFSANAVLALPNNGSPITAIDPTANKLSHSAITTPITVSTGSYYIMLTAYNLADPSVLDFVPIARYTSDSAILLTATGTTTNVPIKLAGIVDGTKNGILEYTTNINSGYTTKTLNVLKKDGTPLDSPINITLVAGARPPLEQSLPSGYYLVKITAAETDCVTEQITEAVHIYPAMTSRITFNATSAPVQNKFTVTFDKNTSTLTVSGGGAYFSTGDGKPQTVYYANKVTAPSTNPTVTDSGWEFKGWYTDAGVTIPYDFTTRIIATTTINTDNKIYAKWAQENGFILTLDNYDIMSNPNPAYSGAGSSLSISNFNGSNTVTITLASPPSPYTAWDTGSITYIINGVTHSSHINTLTLDNSETGFLYLNGFLNGVTLADINVSITATVTTSDPTPVVIPYSAKATIKITN